MKKRYLNHGKKASGRKYSYSSSKTNNHSGYELTFTLLIVGSILGVLCGVLGIFPDHVFTNDGCKVIGADGHEITLLHEKDAKNISYSQVVDFIKQDQTDQIPYQPGKFVCADFAETVQHNAEKAGIKCGYVSIDLSGLSGTSHACDAFNTTDRGLVFIDCTGSKLSESGNQDKIVDIQVGKQYIPKPLFPSQEEGVHEFYHSMGTVKSYKMNW